MSIRPLSFIVSISLLTACGGAVTKNTNNGNANALLKSVKEITAKVGSAKGTSFTGSYTVTNEVTYGKNCDTLKAKVSKHEDLLNTGTEKIGLTQSDGTLTTDDGGKGFINEDNTFSVGYADLASEDIVANASVEGKFTDADNASGTVKILLESKADKKLTCAATSKFTLKRVAPQASASKLTLTVAKADNTTDARSYTNVTAKPLDDKTLEISASGADKTVLKISEGDLAVAMSPFGTFDTGACSIDKQSENGGMTTITFSCDNKGGDALDGTLQIPSSV
jgi:hypothetical protein